MPILINPPPPDPIHFVELNMHDLTYAERHAYTVQRLNDNHSH